MSISEITMYGKSVGTRTRAQRESPRFISEMQMLLLLMKKYNNVKHKTKIAVACDGFWDVFGIVIVILSFA